MQRFTALNRAFYRMRPQCRTQALASGSAPVALPFVGSTLAKMASVGLAFVMSAPVALAGVVPGASTAEPVPPGMTFSPPGPTADDSLLDRTLSLVGDEADADFGPEPDYGPDTGPDYGGQFAARAGQSPFAFLAQAPPSWLRAAAPKLGLVRGIPSLSRTLRPPPSPVFLSGVKTISRGSSVEVMDDSTGLALRAGQIPLPTNPDAAGRPAYLVMDYRPGNYLTAAVDREMGLQASYRPARGFAFTVGAYNNKSSYKFGTLPVKDALTRVDVDLGFAQGGGFYYYGTGRWLGDRTKAGFDVRSRIGPIDLSGQVVHGTSYGIEQIGWYAAASHNLRSSTTLVARVDQHNPNLRKQYGPDSHVVLALVERLSAKRTVKVNAQLGLSDPNRAPVTWGPSNWALIGQLSQRF